MTDYQKYINALKKCAKEHENDRTFTGHIIVSDLCKDTANLLEALEQQPCEDCISRQAAIDYCYQLINVEYQQGSDEMNYGQERVNQTETILHHLELMPHVTPQPNTGKWIKHEHNGIGYIECSECLCWFLESELLRNSYCPNCGAKMVEPQESEE